MKPAPADFQSAVKRYYDHNTPRFQTYGAQQHALTIHRSVWGEGVNDPVAALHYVHHLILSALKTYLDEQALSYARLLDLGCGIGASLFYLAERSPLPVWGLGTTISLVQAELARSLAAQRSLEGRCAFIQADFQHLPAAPEFNLAFAIEAFAHSPDASAFFAQVSRALRPGGRFILCDDVLAHLGPELPQAKNRKAWLDIFQWGWGTPAIFPIEDILNMARSAGLELVSEQDLTPYLRLRTIPGFLTRWLAKISLKLKIADPYWRSVIGGQALQQCYRHGWMAYCFLVFERKT